MENENLKILQLSEYESAVCPRFTEIAYLIQLGYSNKQIADKLFISEKSLYNYKELYPEFNKLFTVNKPLANGKVLSSLFQRATGFNYKETKTSEQYYYKENKHTKIKEQVLDEDGNPIIIATKETTNKYVVPDTSAIKYWLNNRDPDNWKSDTGGATSIAIQNNNTINNTQINFSEYDNEKIENELNSLMEIDENDIIDI